jgi:hypothetical protein
VIDLEPGAASTAPVAKLPERDAALIRASRTRLAFRVQRLRETVADLRLEIEALQRS